MGAFLHLLSIAALLGHPPSTDTTTYADAATAALVARAVARHVSQDTGVTDYSAKLRYRLSFGFAKRKWGDPIPVAVEEQDARLAWHAPNDLRVDLLGRRSRSQLDGVDLSSTFSHPWFVPRGLGDSLRIFGASETPARAAPHPFAPGAQRYYRYAAGDAVRLVLSSGPITIRSITVVPKYSDGAYITGRIWVDVETGDVVRFIFRFVGTQLWSAPDGTTPKDSAAASRESKFVSRILELNADLEYALQDRRHWMPYREVIAGKVSMPLGIDFAIPFEAQTTFDDYQINRGVPVTFDAPFPRDTAASGRGRNGGHLLADRGGRAGARPRRDTLPPANDSLRARRDSAFRRRGRNRTGYLAGGGRYEIHRPPPDSMRAYAGWGDSLVLQDDPADHRRVQQAMTDLAQLSARLPGDMTGRPGFGVAWEHLSDVLRYNRAEGTTLSLGARVPVPVTFADLYGTLRYGFADQRVLARVALLRDAPAGRLIVAASRDLADMDAFADGITFANSLNGIFTGHDNGAYLLAQGLRASYQTSRGPGTELTWSGLAEDERGVTSRARALIPRLVGSSGYFPANDTIRDGFAEGAGVTIDHVAPGLAWTLGLDARHVAGAAAARLDAQARLPRMLRGWATIRLKGGIAVGADSVPQLALRAGGLNTIRGYDFGVTAGDAMWSAQLDVGEPGRGAVKLVGFADIGQAGWLSRYAAAPVLAGVGAGVSILGGLVRVDLSHPLTITYGHGVRVDLIIGAVR